MNAETRELARSAFRKGFAGAISGGLSAEEAAGLCGTNAAETAAAVGALKQIARAARKGAKKGVRVVRKAGRVAVKAHPLALTARAAAAATRPVRRKILNTLFGKLMGRRARYLAWSRRKSKTPTAQERAEGRAWAIAYIKRSGILGKLAAGVLTAGLGPEAPGRAGRIGPFQWRTERDTGAVILCLDLSVKRLGLLSWSTVPVRACARFSPDEWRQLCAAGVRIHNAMHAARAKGGTLGNGVTAAAVTAAIPVLLKLAADLLRKAGREGAPADPEAEAPADEGGEAGAGWYGRAYIEYKPPDSDISP